MSNFSRVRLVPYVFKRENTRIAYFPNDVSYLSSVQGCSDLGSTQRKSHVPRVGSGDGVHGQTTSLVGSSGEGSFGVNLDSGTHLEVAGL